MALRTCKDAFLEVSTVHVNLLQKRLNGSNIDNIKKAVQEALIEHDRVDLTNRQTSDGAYADSYASAVKSRLRFV